MVLRYLGPLLLQTRTKLRNSIKGILNCCKLQIVFNIKNNLSNTFCFKDHIPKELTSGFVHKFQCGLCNQYYYGECVRHLNVRFVEHIAISLLTKKKVKPKGSAINVQLWLCNLQQSFDSFQVVNKEKGQSQHESWKKLFKSSEIQSFKQKH